MELQEKYEIIRNALIQLIGESDLNALANMRMELMLVGDPSAAAAAKAIEAIIQTADICRKEDQSFIEQVRQKINTNPFVYRLYQTLLNVFKTGEVTSVDLHNILICVAWDLNAGYIQNVWTKPGPGLFWKYLVIHTDGSSLPGGKHEKCEHYVLDWQHDKFSIPAMTAYAEACEQEYPELAKGIRERIEHYKSVHEQVEL